MNRLKKIIAAIFIGVGISTELNDKEIRQDVVSKLLSPRNLFLLWKEIGKPKPFIHYWMEVTGHDTNSAEFKELMDWIVSTKG